MQASEHVSVRPVAEADLPKVRAIEAASYPDPWPDEQFAAELRNRCSTGLVALLPDGAIAGYCFYWSVEGEVDIHTITVAPALRRRGIARRLLQQVLDAARRSGASRLLLEVRAGNAAAIGLYAAFGFGRDGVRSRYYPDGEDAVLMSRMLE